MEGELAHHGPLLKSGNPSWFAAYDKIARSKICGQATNNAAIAKSQCREAAYAMVVKTPKLGRELPTGETQLCGERQASIRRIIDAPE
jgi:hypothetical protein